MKKRYQYKDTFAVIGKKGEGDAATSQEWILPLWDAANATFNEIAHLVRKKDDGAPVIWGAMNDIAETNKRWSARGKYMAGCEAAPDSIAPDTWSKWIIPAQTYLIVECSMGEYGSVFNAISNDADIQITGTVHEHYPNLSDPENLELWFPIAEGI